jgi:hypothetical protein
MVKVVGEIIDRNNPACPCVEEVLEELYEGSAMTEQSSLMQRFWKERMLTWNWILMGLTVYYQLLE